MCSRMKPAAHFSWKSNVLPRKCELRKYNCYEPCLFIACRWAASHRCRPTSQGKWDFEVTRCLVHFVWGLGALRAPRPGQRFLAILADQLGDKVAKTVFTPIHSLFKTWCLGWCASSYLEVFSILPPAEWIIFSSFCIFHFHLSLIFPSERFVGICKYRRRSQ